eukprot:TRINITY_DN4683_c0_g1_i9.p1 TRINITY_DN4683_c0_g1~~TRINITY_DN4683_c0_g1_i9.p1  ORF type:complete len:408 (-),score=74.66 TRINITY_DN4683_c0_g1_i9:188-1411(-)
MSVLSKIKWNTIKCTKKELRLDISLKCGQSFRWKSIEHENETIFVGVINKNLLLFKQDEHFLHYSIEHGHMEEEKIKDYFNLGVDLESLYKQWSKVDPIFNDISVNYPGVRMLRQHPVENLFSFICSANNNIQRISGMVENLAKEYGSKVCEFQGNEYYSFPDIDKLAQTGVEAKLRELGFGYRAKYIEESAGKILQLGGEDWLFSLRKMDYQEAKQNLLQLSGIGPKVADCILLMSLDQPSSIPVDTHVFQIAKKYLPHLNNNKTVTNKVYAEIGDHFRNLYGPYAGWAHSVLFSADLRHLQALKGESSPVKESKKNIEKEPSAVKKETKSLKNAKSPKATKDLKIKDESKDLDIKDEPRELKVKDEPTTEKNGELKKSADKLGKKRSKVRAQIDLDRCGKKRTKS